MDIYMVLILVLTQCALLLAAVTNQLASEGKLMGGDEAEAHSHPYIVSLQLRFFWARVHFCGGSILSESWVLTAAHCADVPWWMRWMPMDVVAGAHDVDYLGATAQVVTVGDRIIHPLYEGRIGPNDIAIVKTMKPFVFTKEIQPVKLPMSNEGSMKSLKLAGWGALKTTIFIPDVPSKLQEVEVIYLPYKECYNAIGDSNDDSESNPLDEDANICTGPITGGIAACAGDSGGPLLEYIPATNNDTELMNEILNEDADNLFKNDLKKDKYSAPIIIGIVSWGVSPCGLKGAPTVYTKVSHYIDFINYNMHHS